MSAVNVIRWIARIGSVASTVWLIPFAFSGGNPPTPFEWLMLLFFPIGVMIGFAIGWQREALGGAITVLSLAALYALLFVRDGQIPGGPYFLLFAAPGFLFLLSALMSRRQPQLHTGGA